MKREKKKRRIAFWATLALAVCGSAAALAFSAGNAGNQVFAIAQGSSTITAAASLTISAVPVDLTTDLPVSSPNTRSNPVIPDAPESEGQEASNEVSTENALSVKTLTELPEEETPLSDLPSDESFFAELSKTILPQTSKSKTNDSVLFWGIGMLIAGANFLWAIVSNRQYKDDQDT